MDRRKFLKLMAVGAAGLAVPLPLLQAASETYQGAAIQFGEDWIPVLPLSQFVAVDLYPYTKLGRGESSLHRWALDPRRWVRSGSMWTYQDGLRFEATESCWIDRCRMELLDGTKIADLSWNNRGGLFLADEDTLTIQGVRFSIG